jgi:hemin uptake protein HemP
LALTVHPLFYGPFQTSLPVAIASDGAGNVYEATFALNDYHIKKIATDGKNTIYAGNGSPGHTDGSLLSSTLAPNYLTIDQSGNLYVLQANNEGDLIRKITSTNVNTMNLSNGHILTQSSSNIYPGGEMAIDAKGNIYITDFLGNVIKKIDPEGVISVLAGSGTNGHSDGASWSAQFSNPTGITIDAAGNLYVTEAGNNNDVRKITTR